MENYIGPYWSDGKWQESVEFGTAPTLSDVDAASRLHDSAYARFKDAQHRTAADEIYSATLKKLGGPKSGLADVPLYGNFVKNRVSNIGSDFVTGVRTAGLLGGLGSLVYNGVKGVVTNYDLITNGAKYRDEVMAYYDTDPMKRRPVETARNPNLEQVNIIHTIAPKQSEKEEDMFKKKNKIKPEETPIQPFKPIRPVVINPQVKQYRPLKARKQRAMTADDYLLYLKYHPNDLAKVAAWLELHPLQ
jgi:hypothetical protein